MAKQYKDYSIVQKLIFWIFSVVTILTGVWLIKILIKALFF